MTENKLNDIWNFTIKTNEYIKGQTEDDWLASFKTINKIATIEDYWNTMNNIPSWIDMKSGVIYSIFKNDIQPAWEHPDNINGISLTFFIDKKKNNVRHVKTLYENILIYVISNNYAENKYLNGCTFDQKFKCFKIVIWFNENMTDEQIENFKNDIFLGGTVKHYTINKQIHAEAINQNK